MGQILLVDEASFHEYLTDTRSVIPWKLKNSWYFDHFGKLEKYERASYSHARTFYAGVYLGVSIIYEWPWLSHCRPKWDSVWRDYAAHTGHLPKIDALVPYLATSRDGVSFDFKWIYARQPLPLGGNSSFNIVW